MKERKNNSSDIVVKLIVVIGVVLSTAVNRLFRQNDDYQV